MAGFLIAEIGCRCRLLSQACLPSWFRSWRPLPPCLPSLSPSWFRSLLPLPPCLPSLSPFMISLLAAADALSPKLVSLHDFALACLPSWFCSWMSLRCSWLPLAALSPKLISLPSWLSFQSWFPFSVLGYSWLLPCLPACFFSCFPITACSNIGCRWHTHT